MSQTSFRHPVSQRRSAPQPDKVPGGLKPAGLVLKRNTSRASAMASSAIRRASKIKPFRKPNDEILLQIAHDALAEWFGHDGSAGAMRLNKILRNIQSDEQETPEQEIHAALKAKVVELAEGPFMKAVSLRNLLSDVARQTIRHIAARLPFRTPSAEWVDKIAADAANTRRHSKQIERFDRVLRTYCAACLGYSGRDVVQRYLHDQLRRRMEKLKDGAYIRMPDLLEMLEAWAEEEVMAIEAYLVKQATYGKILTKNQLSSGYEVIEVVIRYQRTRSCFLVVDRSDSDKVNIKALKSSGKYRRNLRKRFYRNARSYSNLPKGKQRR